MNKQFKSESVLMLTLAFALLFYPLETGLNAAIFQLLLVAMCAWYFPPLLKTPKGRTIACINILSAISLFLYGNTLAVFTAMASTACLAAYLQSAHSTFFYAGILAPGNLAMSPIRFLNSLLLRGKKKHSEGSRILAFVIIPSLLLVVFTALYYHASPDFAQVLKSIRFEFSVPRLLFTLALGTVWVFFVFHFYKRRKIRLKEALFGFKTTRRKRAGIALPPLQEHRMGIFVLSMLTIILLTVVVTEVVYASARFGPSGPGAYSGALHRSTLALILSIVLSIVVIQWFLRYKDGMHPKLYSALKYLAGSWMLLNLMLAGIAFFKDIEYVQHFGLSYKRIGVFFYLLAAATGIVYSLRRISDDLNLWYLVRKNAAAIMMLITAASVVPWDMIITHTNIRIAESRNSHLDTLYLRGLRHYDRSAVYTYLNRTPKEPSSGKPFLRDNYHRDYMLSITLNEMINVSKMNKIENNNEQP